MATHSSTPAWKIPWTEEPGRLYSPWGREELDTIVRPHFHFSLSCIGEGNGNPLQCSCLKSPRDRGAWWAAVSGVAQSRTRLKRLSSSKLLYITNHGVPDGHLVCQPHHQTSPRKLSAVFRSPRIFCLLEPHWEKALATHSSILAWKTPRSE